jgi:hypothetical protein
VSNTWGAIIALVHALAYRAMGNTPYLAKASVIKKESLCHGLLWPMGLYQLQDGVTNLSYKLLCLLTPNKIFLRETL